MEIILVPYHVIAREPGETRGTSVSGSGSLSESREFIDRYGPTYPDTSILYIVVEGHSRGLEPNATIYEGYEIVKGKPVKSYKKYPTRLSKGRFAKDLRWGRNEIWGMIIKMVSDRKRKALIKNIDPKNLTLEQARSLLDNK